MILDYEQLGLGVAIIGYRSPERAINLARSLLNDGTPSDRILLIINASDSWNADLGFRCLPLPRNEGYASAANVALAHALANGWSALTLLTHDVAIESSDVRRLAMSLVSEAEAAVAGPVLLDESGQIFSCGGGLHPGGTYHRVDLAAGTAVVDWLDGAVLAVKTRVLHEIGGFDSKLFLYVEDVEVGMRLKNAGYVCLIDYSISARQQVGALSEVRSYASTFLIRRNLVYSYRVNIGLRASLSVAVRLIIACLSKGRGKALVSLLGIACGLLGRLGPPPDFVMRRSDVVYPR